MKRLLPALLLAICLLPPVWAQQETSDIDAAEPHVSVEIDAETSASDAARRDLRDGIESDVRRTVLEALDKAGLTEEQKDAIEEEWEEEWIEIDFDDNEALGVGEALVAILAIILIFGSPVILVAIFLYAGYRKRRLVRDTISQYLANGQPVPPEVFTGLAGEVTPRSNLHKGMILLGVGVGIVLSFWLMGETTIAYLGLIPLFIGAAQLLIWKLEKGKAGAGE